MDFNSFTFLATILVLLFLSASLVLRSYFLRRRYRQRLLHAPPDGFFAGRDGAGQFDTLGGYRRSARRPGPKPAVFDSWLCPTDKVDTWSSLSPVAVRYSPAPSPISSVTSAPLPSLPSTSPSSPQTRPLFFSQLRIPSPFPLSPLPSPPQGRSPIHSPTLSQTQSTPAGPASPNSAACTHDDAARLAVTVLVAMPDASSPVHHPAPDTRGNIADPHAQRQGPSPSLCQPGARRFDDEGLPLLEFGVIEVSTGDWVWRT